MPAVYFLFAAKSAESQSFDATRRFDVAAASRAACHAADDGAAQHVFHLILRLSQRCCCAILRYGVDIFAACYATIRVLPAKERDTSC